MPRSHRYDLLPDEPLEAVDRRDAITSQAQAENMKELRSLHNAIPAAYGLRDDRMYAFALSNALSRRDMATAVGLAESRVNQIVRERADLQQAGWNAAGAARTARQS
jgi:hypothetical protein